MLRKLSIFGLFVGLVVISFAGCKMNGDLNPPVGDSDQYVQIDSNVSEYELAPGTGYYYKKLLPTTAYVVRQSTSFTFTVTKDAKVYYKEALHSDTCSDVDVRHVIGDDVELKTIKEFSDKSVSEEIDVVAGDQVRLSIKVYKYGEEDSTAAEFYIWAE